MRSVQGKAEAHRQAMEIEVKTRLGQSTDRRKGLTTRTIWNKYLHTRQNSISTEYTNQLKRFATSDLKPLMPLKIENIEKAHIQKLLDKKKTPGPRKRIVELLRPFLRWAHREGYMTQSPQALLENLNYGRSAPNTRGTAETVRFFTPAEVFEIAKATTNLWKSPKYANNHPGKKHVPRFCSTTALMILLIANTGMRLGEAKALETRDIQKLGPIPTRIAINRQVREFAGGGREIVLPKGKKTRTIFVPRWTAPTQIEDFSANYRTAADILKKFDAPPSTQTYAEFMEYRLRWLEEKLRPEYPNLKIHTPATFYEGFPDITANFLNFDLYTSICEIDGSTMSLRQLHTQHTLTDPTKEKIWREFADDGHILPLQEMLMYHLEVITDDNATTGNLWTNHEAAKLAEEKILLLWPALRPPRKDTPVPTGDEFAGLPHNGTWVPQQITRDFVRHAIEEAGIFEVVPHNRTRRTLRELRHSFAVAAIRQGLPIDLISTQLGHADTSTTLKLYVGNTGTTSTARPFSL